MLHVYLEFDKSTTSYLFTNHIFDFKNHKTIFSHLHPIKKIMHRYITKDDIRDTFFKGKQRGWRFILSKMNLYGSKRTKSAFNDTFSISSNWWNVPYIKERWNKKISNNTTTNFIDVLINILPDNLSDLNLLSLGSGKCDFEIELAKKANFKNLTCVDLSEYQIKVAKEKAKELDIKNMSFICSDINCHDFNNEKYDIILFNSSLHHFNNIDILFRERIPFFSKNNGYLIINEYVGPTRLQFPKSQIEAINRAIQVIPKRYRKRYLSSMHKNSFSGSGIIRMILADPSECVDSASIMPTIHKHYKTILEKPYGGNILMNTLKDISHHFIELTGEKKEILDLLFDIEDEYLLTYPSDFIFGVYQINN